MSEQFIQKPLIKVNFLLSLIAILIYFACFYIFLFAIFNLISYYCDYSTLSNPFINTLLPILALTASLGIMYDSTYRHIFHFLSKEQVVPLKNFVLGFVIFSIFLMTTGWYNLLHLSFLSTEDQYKITYTDYPTSSEQYRDLKTINDADDVLSLRNLNVMKYKPADLDSISVLINFFNRNENSKLLTIRQEYLELLKKPYVSRYDITEFRQKLISVLKSDIQLLSLISQL